MALVTHPTHKDGKTLWLDPEVQDVVNALANGYPTLGWDGDPFLALYMGPEDRWEVWRLEDDGEYRMFMRSKPGAKLDMGLIRKLVERDSRRGFDINAAIETANAAAHQAHEDRDADKLVAALERTIYEIHRAGGADL